MNALGASLLVFSGATLLFSVFTALLGLDLRRSLQLSRLFIPELLDNFGKRRGRGSLRRSWARWLSNFLGPIGISSLRFLGLHSPRLALRWSAWGFYANFVILSLAILLLSLLLLTGDLSNRYVVSHSSLDLPAFFRLTALWAGSSGSLLFWSWLLSFFCALLVFQSSRLPSVQRPVLFLILAVAQLSFVALYLFFRDAQAFRVYPFAMQSGRGINPLLLHWAMIIHPPILYLGYVSSLLPFALLMSSVIALNKEEKAGQSLLRFWSIFSWFFLGTGILLGSKWAYEELGWGGYWAWDPVENASLMPWLVLTAFLHSLIVQENRGVLRFWNVLLLCLAYHMCLIGTWITRSGVLEGPHSFAESSIGEPMIIFIACSALYFLRFLYFSRRKLRPRHFIESLTSKEGSFLLNNFFMLLAMLIILLGVFSPLLPLDCSFKSGSLECYRVEWKQNAYNRLMVPLGLFALFLMGTAPLLPWTRSVLKISWKKRLGLPLFFGVLGGTIFALSYGLFFTRLGGSDVGTWGDSLISKIMAIITVGISTFTIAGICQEYAQGIHLRRARFTETRMQAFCSMFLQNKRRYGGYLVHLAIVFLFLGYAGSAFKESRKVEFHYQRMPWDFKKDFVSYYSGDSAYIGNYEIQARELFLRPIIRSTADPKNPIYFTISHESHYHAQRGAGPRSKGEPLSSKQGDGKGRKEETLFHRLRKEIRAYIADNHMKTERHFYPQIDPLSGKVLRDPQKQALRIPTSEPDIRSSWNEDLYIQLGALSIPQSEGPASQSVSLNHFYESYYFLFGKERRAYEELFPQSLRASLEIWINPMVKFIWLGSLLFFLSGLILLLPLGETKNFIASNGRAKRGCDAVSWVMPKQK